MSSQQDYVLTHLSAFDFIGIEIRTSNETAEQDIGAFWQRFIREQWQNNIQGRVDEDIIAIYFDYEGDFTQPFKVAIGCRVDSAVTAPPGMLFLNIPAGNYAEFIAKGEIPDCITNTWVGIWNSDLDRTYSFDFEVYSERAKDPENALVEIFIAVK